MRFAPYSYIWDLSLTSVGLHRARSGNHEKHENDIDQGPRRPPRLRVLESPREADLRGLVAEEVAAH